MEILADTLHTKTGIYGMQDNHDVPHKLKIGKKPVYLGRYLVSKLRKNMGMPDKLLDAIKNEYMLEASLMANHGCVS